MSPGQVLSNAEMRNSNAAAERSRVRSRGWGEWGKVPSAAFWAPSPPGSSWTKGQGNSLSTVETPDCKSSGKKTRNVGVGEGAATGKLNRALPGRAGPTATRLSHHLPWRQQRPPESKAPDTWNEPSRAVQRKSSSLPQVEEWWEGGNGQCRILTGVLEGISTTRKNGVGWADFSVEPFFFLHSNEQSLPR